MINLAFIGKAGSGKSTICDEIIKTGMYCKLSFAKPVKEIAEEILLRPLDKSDPLDRKFLQQLGTELGRARQKDIWIKHFDKEIEGDAFLVPRYGYVYIWMQKKDLTGFLVDDCRFENEAEYLKEKGFIIIKVIGRSSDLGQNALHESEIEQDKITPDIIIDNGGPLEKTIKDLLEQLEEYMRLTN